MEQINYIARDKGIDEHICSNKANKKMVHAKGYNKRRDIPTYPIFKTYEDAVKSVEPGFIYAVRVSHPWTYSADLGFPTLYVKATEKDRSAIRKTYNEFIKDYYSSLRMRNRVISHFETNNTFYQRDITSRRIS